MMNDTMKKLTSLSLAALMLTSAGAVSAYAEKADTQNKDESLLAETTDTPEQVKKETTDSPLESITNITG